MIIQSTTLDTEEKVIEIYGGSKWSKIEGRFLLGASSSYKANTTGGESSHTLTINEMPSHTHGVGSLASNRCISDNSSGVQGLFINGTTRPVGTVATGEGQAHNNMPPYKAVYIWERIL